MGFGAPASEKLTQKTNAKNKAKSAQNQRKISAQKFSIKQGADIKCVKKDLLPKEKYGRRSFCYKCLQKRFKHCVFKVFVHTKRGYVGDCLGF